MSESGLETLLNVRESLPDVREWSGVFLECPGVVGSPSWMSGSGRESLLNAWEWLRSPRRCPRVVKRPSQMSGSGREAHPNVQEWS